MLIPLGFLASAGGGVDTDYELISTEILGSSQSSITFDNLGDYSSTYKHLQIRLTTKSAGTNQQFFLRFNADTATNYNYHQLLGDGSSVQSYATANATQIIVSQFPPSTGFVGAVVDLLDVYSTSKNKTTRSLAGIAESSYNQVALFSGAWRSTSSVTSITLATAQNIAANSRYSLYGIKG